MVCFKKSTKRRKMTNFSAIWKTKTRGGNGRRKFKSFPVFPSNVSVFSLALWMGIAQLASPMWCQQLLCSYHSILVLQAGPGPCAMMRPPRHPALDLLTQVFLPLHAPNGQNWSPWQELYQFCIILCVIHGHLILSSLVSSYSLGRVGLLIHSHLPQCLQGFNRHSASLALETFGMMQTAGFPSPPKCGAFLCPKCLLSTVQKS